MRILILAISQLAIVGTYSGLGIGLGAITMLPEKTATIMKSQIYTLFFLLPSLITCLSITHFDSLGTFWLILPVCDYVLGFLNPIFV